MGPPRGSDELERRVRDADARGLVELLLRHRDELDVPTVRHALRNPFVTAEAIEIVLGLQTLLGSYELRRDLAVHPRTPEVAALRFVPGLFWRDLMRVGSDTRVRPKVRQAADRHLGNRLPALTVGEKISLARTAGAGVLTRLRQDPEPRVFAAVLQNPRLTEGLLLPILASEGTPSEILSQLGRSHRWGTRYAVRLALVRHPRTPISQAVALVSTLKKSDLRALTREARLRPPVRRRLELLLGLGSSRAKLTSGRRGD